MIPEKLIQNYSQNSVTQRVAFTNLIDNYLYRNSMIKKYLKSPSTKL